jgi:hypothetical protein
MLTKTPSELRASVELDARPVKRVRDPRLDVFRGMGMFIILMAHIPGNQWTLWIPARFGFSDATEMFVFLSGMASAIAFGRTFDRSGALMGTARVGQRIWQIYWTHIAVFMTIAGLMVAAGQQPHAGSYVESLNLQHFFEDPAPQLLGLLTLTYVPNYFDILPMYMVILALMPVMLLAERAHRALPFALMAGIWGLTQAGLLPLPAEPWSSREWFFDPFGWQLLFFIGFFIMRGTLPTPRFDRRLVVVAVMIVLITVPFAWYRVHLAWPATAQWASDLLPFTDKTHFGVLRLVHFMALAYLAAHAVGERGHRLRGRVVAVVSKVGQQSLAVFVAGMVGAQVIGIMLDHIGRGGLATAVANILGIGMMIAVAYATGWFKSAPWKA